jgi:endonuclease/exonuclease/phosphatase (EEP) superfamily protein YafD
LSWLVVAYALLVVGWLIARAIWGDQALAVAVINSFPTAPFALLPLAVLAAVLARKPASWAALLVLLGVWAVLFGVRFLPRGESDAAEHADIGIMAFNVLWSNEDVDAIAGAISAAYPDLAVLPELTIAQDDELARRLGDAYPYRILSRLDGAGFGVGIYSRWPLTDLGSIQTGLGLRSATADVATPFGQVRVIGAHPRATEGTRKSLQALLQRMRESFRGREAQVAGICEYLDDLGDQPVIVAGDFNLSELSDGYRCLGGRLTDAYRAVGRGYGFTWPGDVFQQGRFSGLRRQFLQSRIDYVFHSDHFRPAGAATLRVRSGSDHWPVLAWLRQSGQPTTQ